MLGIHYRTHIEHVLVEHCNLRCDNCATGSPYIKEGFSSLENFTRDVRVLATCMKINYLRFIGGEPTLHPQFVDFCKVAKDSGLADYVSVATNGLSLMSQSAEFWEVVDLINLTMYPNTNVNYIKIIKLIKSKRVRLHIHGLGQDQFTEYEHEIADQQDIDKLVLNEFTLFESHTEHSSEVAQDIFNECGAKDICHSVMDGKYYRCSISVIKDNHYKAIGVHTNYNFKEEDGLPIDGDFHHRYADFVSSQEININACRHCNGAQHRDEAPHRQLSQNQIAAVLVES